MIVSFAYWGLKPCLTLGSCRLLYLDMLQYHMDEPEPLTFSAGLQCILLFFSGTRCLSFHFQYLDLILCEFIHGPFSRNPEFDSECPLRRDILDFFVFLLKSFFFFFFLTSDCSQCRSVEVRVQYCLDPVSHRSMSVCLAFTLLAFLPNTKSMIDLILFHSRETMREILCV